MRPILFTLVSALLLLLQSQSCASALGIKDLDDLEFQKVNISKRNRFSKSDLDPHQLDVLERLKGSQKIGDVKLRSKPLKGLNKIVFNSEFGNLHGKGSSVQLHEFAVRADRLFRQRFKKLGIKVEFPEKENSDVPVVFLHGFIVNQDPRYSFVSLTVQEKFRCERDPEQFYDMATFKLERFGRDTEKGGKDLESIVNLTLDRFEYFWRFANEPKKLNLESK